MLQKYEQAIPFFEMASKKDKKTEWRYYSEREIGECYFKLGDFDKAETAFEKYLELKRISGNLGVKEKNKILSRIQ